MGNTSRQFDLGSVERDYRLNRVVAADGELGRVITIHIDCFDVFAGKCLAKPAPFDPAQVLEDPKSRHTGWCHHSLRISRSESIDFSFDHGSVPVQKAFKGLALTPSHAQVVLHGRSLRSEGPMGPNAPGCRRHPADKFRPASDRADLRAQETRVGGLSRRGCVLSRRETGNYRERTWLSDRPPVGSENAGT